MNYSFKKTRYYYTLTLPGSYVTSAVKKGYTKTVYFKVVPQNGGKAKKYTVKITRRR